jgi:hypothetical protein
MKPKITIVVPLDLKSKINIGKDLNINEKKIETIIVRGKNPSENRNSGIKIAHGKLIGFINGHTRLTDNWAEEVEKFLLNYPEIDIVGGPQLTNKEGSLFERSSGYALSSYFGAGEVNLRYKQSKINLDADETILTSANLICKKKVFNKINFDEKFYPGEDPKFISDAKKEGFKVAYSPDILVYNERRKSFKELAKQIFNYGKMRPIKESINETLKKPYFLAPTLFLLYLIFLLIYSDYEIIMINKINMLFFLPLLIYIILAIVFSIKNGLVNKDVLSMFIMPFIYLTIHLSYGLGFLVSSITKYIRK